MLLNGYLCPFFYSESLKICEKDINNYPELLPNYNIVLRKIIYYVKEKTIFQLPEGQKRDKKKKFKTKKLRIIGPLNKHIWFCMFKLIYKLYNSNIFYLDHNYIIESKINFFALFENILTTNKNKITLIVIPNIDILLTKICASNPSLNPSTILKKIDNIIFSSPCNIKFVINECNILSHKHKYYTVFLKPIKENNLLRLCKDILKVDMKLICGDIYNYPYIYNLNINNFYKDPDSHFIKLMKNNFDVNILYYVIGSQIQLIIESNFCNIFNQDKFITRNLFEIMKEITLFPQYNLVDENEHNETIINVIENEEIDNNIIDLSHYCILVWINDPHKYEIKIF